MLSVTLRMALRNMKAGRRTWIPFACSSLLCFVMVYLISGLASDPALPEMMGGNTLTLMMRYGQVILLLFSAVFLFYANSFLLKQRKRETGLYHILGLDKQDVVSILVWELLLTALITTAAGIPLGILLEKGMLMALVRLLGTPVAFTLQLNTEALAATMTSFAIVYAILILYTAVSVSRMKPISMLQAANAGQKEPKARWLLAILGLLSLTAGYAIALQVQSPIAAFSLFFVAVLLVMAGTYLLFLTGTTALLKLLEKNRPFYYQTSHFITISQLKYRMKANAVSLANICILSTMIVTAASTTVCLWAGVQQMIDRQFFRDILIQSSQNPDTFLTDFDTAAAQAGIQMENLVETRTLDVSAIQKGDQFVLSNDPSGLNQVWMISVMTQQDWKRLTGEDLDLDAGQAAISPTKAGYEPASIAIQDQTYQTIPLDLDLADMWEQNFYVTDLLRIVVPDEEDLQAIYQANLEAYGDYPSQIKSIVGFDGSQQDLDAVLDHLYEMGYEPVNTQVKGRDEANILALFGGFLFLGIFVSVLFLAAVVLILFYKQVSEGLEDARRFAIMQKVGLEKAAIRRTIRFQVLLVFFAPLVLGFVHLAFAFPMVSKLLSLFAMHDTVLFLVCTLGVCAVFTLVYVLAYALTSRTYYRMVQDF